ncbi:MAG TPA: thiamine-phosphate kinase [Methylomirabilota bacterium]|nr:thiamine-phosphate kinase [Methylomirabilota bacterium]
MNEFELIQRLCRCLPSNAAVVAGPGDDCAVLDLGLADRWVLFKTDAVVEGIHFTREADPRRVGHKALARCLSDVAAMSGLPTAAVVTLALPPAFDAGWVEAIYAGLGATARQFGVAIVGGETTTNPERMLLSVALVGTVEKARCVRRSGAQPGDALFVSGELGGSLAGRHLEFVPRLVEARWLTEHFAIHSMIDLSDGLAGDVRHLLQEGRCGVELLKQAIPISRAARLQARGESSVKPPLLAALTDGEDFELLFTVASRDAVAVLDGWKARFPEVKLSCIGRITPEPGVRLRDGEWVRPLNVHGYIHFA